MNPFVKALAAGLFAMLVATFGWTQQQDKIQPDTRPLSGAHQLSLGTPGSSINVVNSSIRLAQMLDSNSPVEGRRNAWVGDSDVFAEVSINRSWRHNSFTAQYDGGGLLSAEKELQNTHILSLSQIVSWRRWSIAFQNEAFYSSESLFGTPGIANSAINVLGTQTNLLPNQTIFTSNSTRTGNTSIAQAEYAFGRRSSVTTTASYGLLHYHSSGAPESDQVALALGYNYVVGSHDTIALTYAFDRYRLKGLVRSRVDIQRVDALYAHRVTGRLSGQISLGAGLATTNAPGLQSSSNVYPDVSASLEYAWPRTQLSLSASKSVVSGAGLAAVSDLSEAQVGLSHQLTRKWMGSINAGIAENSLLGVGPKVRSARGDLALRRDLNRHAGVFVGYNLQRQLSHSICTGSVCAGNFRRQVVTVGLEWRFSPHNLR